MDEEQDNLESENQDNGGETVEKQTTEKEESQPDYKKIAEDQKKRAEIAEAKLKEKPKITEKTNPAPTDNVDPVEIATLANELKGLSKEEIDFAKTIAAGSKTTLLKALQHEAFQAYHAKNVAEERKKKAALGASKGSEEQTYKAKKSLVHMTPDEQRQEREEHQATAMAAAQNIQ